MARKFTVLLATLATLLVAAPAANAAEAEVLKGKVRPDKGLRVVADRSYSSADGYTAVVVQVKIDGDKVVLTWFANRSGERCRGQGVRNRVLVEVSTCGDPATPVLRAASLSGRHKIRARISGEK